MQSSSKRTEVPDKPSQALPPEKQQEQLSPEARDRILDEFVRLIPAGAIRLNPGGPFRPSTRLQGVVASPAQP